MSTITSIRSKFYISFLCTELGVNRNKLIAALCEIAPTELHAEIKKFRTSIYRYSDEGTEIKNQRFIEIMEVVVPGTKRIYRHPFWDVMCKPNMALSDLIEYGQKLAPPLINFI